MVDFNKADFIKNKINNYYKNKSFGEQRLNFYIRRKKKDIIYKIIHNLNNRIYETFKKKLIIKNIKYSEYLGCNPLDFKTYLENT